MFSLLARLVAFFLRVVMAITAAATAYLAFLAGLAVWPGRRKVVTAAPTRFAVLIPAHNEEKLIGSTLASLAKLNYPSALYDVYVVADNCTDATAALARKAGAKVYERTSDQRGKGFALEWLLAQIPTEPDAFVFLDADSTVSPNFLEVMASYLADGAGVVQAYYGGANPDTSWRSALRYIALAAINYARPMGRKRLGLSAGLKGNGMVFRADILRQIGWSAYTRAEDTEMHTKLLLLGQTVRFAPECQVWGVMAVNRQQATTQEMRWEAGRLEIARQFIPRLWQASRRQPLRQRLVLLDGAFEIAYPPISAIAGLGVAGLASGAVLRDRRLASWSALVLGGLTAYIGASLVAVRASRSVYQALLYAPFFIVWKLVLYARAVLTGQRNRAWQRTERS